MREKQLLKDFAYMILKKRGQGNIIINKLDCRWHMTITADANNMGIGACLNQIQNGECQLLGFFSRKLSEAKRRTNNEVPKGEAKL